MRDNVKQPHEYIHVPIYARWKFLCQNRLRIFFTSVGHSSEITHSRTECYTAIEVLFFSIQSEIVVLQKETGCLQKYCMVY